MSIINKNEQRYYQQQLLRMKHFKKHLDMLATNINDTLLLHVYLFHDMMVHPSSIVNKIDFGDCLNRGNMMIITYDNIIKVICKPILATPESIELVKNQYMYLADIYSQLTLMISLRTLYPDVSIVMGLIYSSIKVTLLYIN